MAKRPTTGTNQSGNGATLAAALSSRDVSQILGGVLDRIDADRKGEMQLEVHRAKAETELLTVDLKRLTEKHGKDHPRVRRVQAMQLSMARQTKMAEAIARRIETLKPPENGGWTAAGRVWDPDGAPVVEAEVGFVLSGEGNLPRLEPTKTDDEGEFYATYSRDIVRQLIERKTLLALVIRSGRTVLYQDPESFIVQANAIRQFRVRLEKPRKEQGKR